MFIHAQINFIQNDVYFSHLYFSTNLTVRFTKNIQIIFQLTTLYKKNN